MVELSGAVEDYEKGTKYLGEAGIVIQPLSQDVIGNGNMLLMYQPKTYRYWIRDTGLVSCNGIVKETDLYIRAWRNLRRRTLKEILKYRASIEGYIGWYPSFFIPDYKATDLAGGIEFAQGELIPSNMVK